MNLGIKGGAWVGHISNGLSDSKDTAQADMIACNVSHKSLHYVCAYVCKEGRAVIVDTQRNISKPRQP